MVSMRPPASSSSSSSGEGGVSRIGLGPALTPATEAGQSRLVPPAGMKSKKSLEWLSKSFKRKPSSNGVPRGDRKGVQEGSRANNPTTSMASADPLLSEPNPRYSPEGLSTPSTFNTGGKSPSDSGASTKSFRFPGAAGRDIHEVRLPTLPSEGRLSSDSPYTTNVNAAPKQSKLSPLPSPSSIVVGEKGLNPSSANQDSAANSLLTVDGRQTPKPKNSADYEKLLVSLSSRKVLRTMLDDPVGLWKFGQFLASEMNAETLVFWLNAEQHRNDAHRLMSLTKRIHSLHIPSNAPLALNITSTERTGIERAIQSFVTCDNPFKVAKDAAFQNLYTDAWPRFLQWRLELLHSKLRHGGLTPPETSFTLADPSRDRDQPLLLASDGFLDLTGYSRSDVLMRNCRFLQGPGTEQAKIERIRNACQNGLYLTELVLNYRKDGVPFWSLLRIIPLRNASGKLKYLLGAQINVTSVLAATADLAHLLADELDPVDMPPRPPFELDGSASQSHSTNEAMRTYLTSLEKATNDGMPRRSEVDRREISKRNSLLDKFPGLAAVPSGGSAANAPGASSVSGEQAANAMLGLPNLPSVTVSKSSNRDMHLHAATALAFDGTMGSTSPARPSSSSSQPGIHGMEKPYRPTTANTIFQRPGTAMTVVDTEGKARAQLSLAEQAKEFDEASSHYLILDSSCNTVLFHSSNLPTNINIGFDASSLLGNKPSKRIKEAIKQGDRIEIDSVKLNVNQNHDREGVFQDPVKICVTPMKDQIGEVGAVVVLIQTTSSSTAR